MWETFINATSVEQVLALLAKHGQDARVINGGTDLIFEAEAARLAVHTARPIDDIRGTAEYRRDMVRVLVVRTQASLRDGTERDDSPSEQILLWGKADLRGGAGHT